MNKAILTSFTILCLLSIPLIMEYGIAVKTEPTIWYVDNDDVTGPWDGTKEHPYQNITNALEHAIDGDTVFVYEGTYYEKVFVNKSVSLIGEDRETTIIDGGEIGSVIFVTANSVNINGFTIQKSGRALDDSGIFVEHSSGNNLSHNTIINNNYGISLHSIGNNVVSDNTITNNNYGISLHSTGNNVVSDNTITNNNYGISLHSTGNNVVSSNTMTNNYDGIVLYYSDNNVVSDNTITNKGSGIILFDSNNNVVFNNNFVNNTQQAYSYSSINVWDNGVEGNYWSNYVGVDSNHDGIGDSSHVIDEDNQDNNPLMGMFSDFNVALKRKTYYITTVCNSTISEFRFEIGAETGNKIIRFNVAGKDSTVGFCRVTIPTELMNYPYIVLVGVEEIVPILLDVSNETYVYLYFTYIHSGYTITIISSKTLHLYNELLDKHVKLQIDLHNLNVAYHGHLNNYNVLLGNYSQLQKSYHELNNSYQQHLNNYNVLLGNYSQLQKSYHELNNSYQQHLLDYSKNVHNIRNLMYIFAATTAIFIITTIYLSKRAHAGKIELNSRLKLGER